MISCLLIPHKGDFFFLTGIHGWGGGREELTVKNYLFQTLETLSDLKNTLSFYSVIIPSFNKTVIIPENSSISLV